MYVYMLVGGGGGGGGGPGGRCERGVWLHCGNTAVVVPRDLLFLSAVAAVALIKAVCQFSRFVGHQMVGPGSPVSHLTE